jgi:uncharacterized protein DUF4037
MSSPTFVPAVELSGAFYQDVVRPLLVGRAHSAALLGRGSEVLGYDTPRSTDHDWGPRLQIFLDRADQVAEFDRDRSGGAFVARTAEVGDEVGSAVTAARLVRDLIRLAMLLDHRYWPYQKWLGTAFARREHGGQHHDGLPDHLTAALHARGVAQREAGLAHAYTALAERHNAAGLTEPLDPTIRGTTSGRPGY